MRNPTDAELMRLVREGQQQALTELYDRHSRIVYSMAYRVAGKEPLAREIVQLVYTRLWTTKAEYDGNKGVFSSWLITITRHIAIDVLRRERKYRSVVSIEETIVMAASEDGVPEEELERKDTQSAISMASRSLSAPQRRVIDLMYWKGYTLHEIAEMGGEPIGTVKNRLHQALKTLRRHLQGLKEER